MPPTTSKEQKSKFTASVNHSLVVLVDEQAAKLNVTRSHVIEEAMEMWLRKQADLEEEKYFQRAAAEMNEDARSWNATTTTSARHTME